MNSVQGPYQKTFIQTYTLNLENIWLNVNIFSDINDVISRRISFPQTSV